MGMERVATQLGYSEGWIRYQLGLEGMPTQVKKYVEKGALATYEAAQLKPLLRHKRPEEVTEVVKEIVRLRTGIERRRAISEVKRNPDLSPQELKSVIKKKPTALKIVIEISSVEMEALERAAQDQGSSPSDVAHSVINEWLKTSGYIQ